MVAALGVRASGGWGSLDGWTSWALVAAVLTLMVKSETDLVHTARAYAGLPLLEDKGSAPRGSRSRSLRRALQVHPVLPGAHRRRAVLPRAARRDRRQRLR
jgi:hypothetical protein